MMRTNAYLEAEGVSGLGFGALTRSQASPGKLSQEKLGIERSTCPPRLQSTSFLLVPEDSSSLSMELPRLYLFSGLRAPLNGDEGGRSGAIPRSQGINQLFHP